MPVFKVNLKYATLTEVTDGLFVCGVSELKPDILWKLGITCIINCTCEVPNLPASPIYDFERIKLWLDDVDDVDIAEHLDDVADKVREVKSDGGKTLVHCLAGVSRSATFAMAYLMKHENLSLRRAYAHCALKRPMVRPNLGFWRQLMEYERRLRGGAARSVRLVRVDCDDGGAVQLVPDVYLDAASFSDGRGGRLFGKMPTISDAMTSSDGESDLGASPPQNGIMTSSSFSSERNLNQDDSAVTSSSISDDSPMTSSSIAPLFGALPITTGCNGGAPDVAAAVARILNLKSDASDDDDWSASPPSTCASTYSRRSSGRRFTPSLEVFPESELDDCVVGGV